MAKENLSGHLNLSYVARDDHDVEVVRKWLKEHQMTASELVRVAVSYKINYDLAASDSRTSDYDVQGASAVRSRLAAKYATICGRLAIKNVAAVPEFAAFWEAATFTTQQGRLEAYELLARFASHVHVKLDPKILVVSDTDAKAAGSHEHDGDHLDS